MESILFVIKSVFSFIWAVIVWCFDVLAWIIRSISDVYHWFMGLDTMYKVIIGVVFVILIAIGLKAAADNEAKERAERNERDEERWRRKHTCPSCGEIRYYHVRYNEVDRFDSTKEVSETTASGQIKTRHVKCVKVVEEDIWACKECGYEAIKDKNTRILD